MTERERFERWYIERGRELLEWGNFPETVAEDAWQSARQWIPVSEQPPESEILVMCYDSDTEEFYFGHMIDGHFESSHGYIFRATHWQPIPEPPEEV